MNDQIFKLQRNCLEYCEYLSKDVFYKLVSYYTKIFLKFSLIYYVKQDIIEVQFNGALLDHRRESKVFDNFTKFSEWINNKHGIRMLNINNAFIKSKNITLLTLKDDCIFDEELIIGGISKFISNYNNIKSEVFPISMLKVKDIHSNKTLMVGEYIEYNEVIYQKYWKQLKNFFVDRNSNSTISGSRKISAILTPDVSSILFHEACGHFLEADLVLSNCAPFKTKDIGKKVTCADINVINDCTSKLIGSEPFDDEGTAGIRQYLIKNGRIVSFMVDNYYSKILNIPSAGNHRTMFPLDTMPHVRMTNIVVQSNMEIKNCSYKENSFILTGVNKLIVRNNGDFELDIDSIISLDSGKRSFDIVYRDNTVDFLNKVKGAKFNPVSFTGVCYKGGIDMKGEKLLVTNTAPSVYVEDITIQQK